MMTLSMENADNLKGDTKFIFVNLDRTKMPKITLLLFAG
jgi:hypothetical protein